MTFELLTVTPWVVALAVVALVAVVLAVVAVTDVVRTHRPVRMARHESIRSYYGRPALHH
ncbi:hypothetical protein [Nocardioides lijunqiniae]|uniref:hypothetical protein n=1 Tax=Nocardioides lijunqiniae TaxID=2760832 RepID=UPI001878A455|nr:hypothetical protein [Nocardioides lijunqiniae]